MNEARALRSSSRPKPGTGMNALSSEPNSRLACE
ncbi:Uncharacterised protein [Bordetella pertussis]|nr:Uncharacterised protein [Bordetella pertussis]CFP64554.1 Uncharacterised protein [Bordetella pertussis]CFW46618.1 Uncharacterised protein [Bordetella pertussis]